MHGLLMLIKVESAFKILQTNKTRVAGTHPNPIQSHRSRSMSWVSDWIPLLSSIVGIYIVRPLPQYLTVPPLQHPTPYTLPPPRAWVFQSLESRRRRVLTPPIRATSQLLVTIHCSYSVCWWSAGYGPRSTVWFSTFLSTQVFTCHFIAFIMPTKFKLQTN